MTRTLLSLFVVSTLALTGCDVDVKDKGAPPNVDVKPGRAPDVDVTGPDVDVGTKETTVDVPNVDIDVNSQERTVETPAFDIDVPEEGDNE